MKELHPAYELIKEQELDGIHSKGYLLKHKKTQATISLISNDDYNKVFYIGFRTPPTDSTGVAHIIEHTVLCGSGKYPLKDPFVELVKGSLNTFINAITYPDKTMYPVASTNDKDFHNLMDVYMDAVFNPNIYKVPEIFKQEGWHYELNEPDGEITINGVVYNEMKGAFSSPDDVLERQIMTSLFPDTTYAIESGGDPDVIPELTREDYLDFHRRYYHPSNSYIYMYGDMDMAERLDYLDREYLSKYDRLDIDSEVKLQKSFEKPVTCNANYSIGSEDDPDGKTYFSMNYVIGKYDELKLMAAFSILDYALLSSPGAPLDEALHDAGIGEDISGGFDGGTIQPVFSVIAKNTDFGRKDDFEKVINDTLEKVIKKGLNKEVLLAGIEIQKFRFIEADYGSFPKGLIYGLGMMDTWLYNKEMPFDTLDAVRILDELKREVENETGYFEKLIKEHLIDNSHRSMVILNPEPGLTGKKDEELKNKLKEYKATLSEDEIKALIEDTKALRKYQEEPTPDEDLRKIPLLERKDLRKEIRPLTGKLSEIDGITVMNNDIETNGIQYLVLHFLPRGIDIEDVPGIAFFTKVFGLVATEKYTYRELSTRVNACSGGIVASLRTHGRTDDTSVLAVSLRLKTFYENAKEAEDLLMEMLFRSKFDDKKRIREILLQEKSQMEGYLMSSGHVAAALRAGSYVLGSALIGDNVSGIGYYRYLQNFDKNFDSEYEKFIKLLEKMRACVFNENNLLINNIGKKEAEDNIKSFVPLLKKEMASYNEKGDHGFKFSDVKDLREGYIKGTDPGEFEGKRPINEGFKTAGQVQYVCRAGSFHKEGYDFTGAMWILKVILGYDYFWVNIRVKGGAYGCMGGFSRAGDMHFASYRDPNLKDTVDIFENTPDYLRNFNPDERDMTKYIIGTLSSVDMPLTPAQRGKRNFLAYVMGYSEELLQKQRDQILNCQPEDIRALAPLVEDTLKQNYVCVIGNEDKMKESEELFNSMENLIG